MPSIRIQNFGGVAPRLSDRLLPPNAATVANNTKLWSGEVRPFRAPKAVPAALQSTEVKTIYRLRDLWLSWAQDVDVARGFIPGDATERFYFTGTGVPQVSDYTLAGSAIPPPGTSYPLGVANPVMRPTVTLGVGGPGTAVTRSYVYTFVTSFDEEGPPSDPSVLVDVLPGQAVVVSGFSVPTTLNVDRIRIYRSETTTTTTEYFYVDEIALGVTSYTDTTPTQELGDALITQSFYPPPPAMIGLVSHPDGFLAGFTSNQLHLSESYQPHAWPPEYVKVFDFPVVALGVYGNTIVVATTGFTYLVTGVDPRNMTVEKLPDPYPCVSKQSMVSGDRGVIYASNDGLVWVGYGGLQVITRDLLSRDEWQLWNPATIHGCVYDGRYVGFVQPKLNAADEDYDRADDEPTTLGFMFDYADRATQVDQRDRLTTFDFYATATYAAPGETFYFVTRDSGGNKLQEWDTGAGYLPYDWRSKAFVMPYLTSFAAAKVIGRFPWKGDTDNGRQVVFELWVGTHLKYTRPVESSEPFRLPRFFREVEPWYVRIKGTEIIQEIHLATSMEELREGKAQ